MSSSSSSSECNCRECCYYGDSQNSSYGRNVGYRGCPFYPTMGQPLVYYAQTQQQEPITQRSRDKSKRNPNCFVKAFRWYTQEHVHVPQRSSKDVNRNMTGFATWLDSKYDEFLRDSQIDKSGLRLKFKQTSLMEAETIPQYIPFEPCATKTFRGMQSPCKKGRQRSKEGGDSLGKPTQSFEYILRPKDLLHTTSESYNVNPTTNYNPSDATLMKHSNKSISLTNVRKEKDKEPTDIIVVHEGSKIKKQKAQQQDKEVKPKMKASKLGLSYIIAGSPESVDDECQCPEKKIDNAETGSQYDSGVLLKVGSKQFSPTKVHKMKPHKRVHTEYIQDPCPCSKEHTSEAFTCGQRQQQDEESQIIAKHKMETQKASLSKRPTKTVKCSSDNVQKKDSYTMQKNQEARKRVSNPHKVFVSDGVQTFDDSIIIGKNTVYPLFMKIMNADKLK